VLWEICSSREYMAKYLPSDSELRISSFMSYFFNVYNLVTNLVASRSVHAEMLTFTAEHDIKPLVEEFPMTEEGMAEAIAKLENGKIRYRAVLKA
jgi:D-arabinose 1-dehydrogenase-like Zn-dependent alcohol dehydrogenase